MEIDLSILAASPLFQGLETADIKKFLDCAKPQILEADAGATLKEQGEPLQHVLLLLKGSILLLHTEYGGHTTIIDYISTGDIYGQNSVFNEHAQAQARISAETPIQYMLFKGSIFYRHCSLSCVCHQIVTRNMIQLLSSQLSRLSEKIAYLSCSSLKGKIALYLRNQSRNVPVGQPFIIPFNREDMALYLNTQRPSLSRALRQMKEDGWIDYERSVFRILDPHALINLE